MLISGIHAGSRRARGAFCMLRENIIMYIMWLKNATEQINELLKSL